MTFLGVKPRKVSVQFSHSVMSNSLRSHGLQHTKPPCPSPTPGVHLNPCSLSQWWHPTISSSVVPFSSCLQSFSASGSFQRSQLFAWGGQSIGVSASTAILPMNIQDWFPLGLTSLISLLSKGLSGMSQTSNRTHVFCTGKQVFSTEPQGKPPWWVLLGIFHASCFSCKLLSFWFSA